MERIRIKDIARLADVSVGTVDRVLHGRSGVSEASKQKVKNILKQLDYQPNMYASALASNKKYTFACLLPQHEASEYWTDVETGIHKAIDTYSDFNIEALISHYDPYDYHSFAEAANALLTPSPDGVLLAPTAPQFTCPLTKELTRRAIPYIYRFQHQGAARIGILRARLTPERILCRTHADVAGRRGRTRDSHFP